MDKFALNEKRRETVTSLLKGMDIKTADGGGLDKSDVLDCLQQVCNLYESHIDELEKNYESEIGDLTKRYQKYDENNDIYVSLIMDAKKSSKELIDQATREVDDILASGREKIELQEREFLQYKEDCEKEKESIAAELQASKDYAEAEKAAMRLDIEAEREKLEATKNKYRQQIVAMEEEFSEIRANILRTSARLDSLKAQSEDETAEIEWDVKEAADEVQVPGADLEIDQILEVEPEVEAEPESDPFEPLASDEAFKEAFFKSDILASAPKAEEPAEEPAPAVEEPAAEPEKDITVEELLAGMDALTLFEEEKEPDVSVADALEEAIDEEAVEEPVQAVEEMPEEEPVAEVPEEIPVEIPAETPAEEPAPAPVEALEEIPMEAVEEPVQAVEEMPEEVPAIEEAAEIPAEEPAPVAEAEDDIEALLNEISFDDILDEGTEETAVIAEEDLDEINLDELIGMEDITEVPVEAAPEAPAAPEVAEEISFEKLEALFKEEQ